MADIRTSDLGFEVELFIAADRLRGNLEPLDDDALLDNVAVPRRARGKGIGRILIDHAERDAGLDKVTLYTNEKMTENLYPRLGYRETHRATEKGLNRVYFAKALPG